MGAKVLPFDNSIKRYRALAEKRAEINDYAGALSLLFDAEKKNPTKDVIADIAQLYSEIEEYELSNRYWYDYIDKTNEKDAATAYEALAVNFFYMDNLWAAGYYFHKKISVDGFSIKEGLERDVIDFFTEATDIRNAYYVAYPFDRADYSFKAKNAKNAVAMGDFKTAIKIYESIPEPCRNEEISGDYAIALYITKKDDRAIAECKSSIKRNGDNVTAYCVLSGAYRGKGDEEKSRYYYARALECAKGKPNEVYKIATCALDLDDTPTAVKCLSEIIAEREYEVEMLYYYGIALINSGDYKGAHEALKKARLLSPKDDVVRYYLNFCVKLIDGDAEAQSRLPLKYIKDVPSFEAAKRKRKLREWTNAAAKGRDFLKADDNLAVLRWGLYYSDVTVAQRSVFLLSVLGDVGIGILLVALRSAGVDDTVKRIILYTLLCMGYNKRFTALVGDVAVCAKAGKTVFSPDALGDYYKAAYALCVSKLVFYGITDLGKVTFSANRLYKNYGDSLIIQGVKTEELAALILYESKMENVSGFSESCGIFGVEENRFKNILNSAGGELIL